MADNCLADKYLEMSQSQEEGQSQASVSIAASGGRRPKNCLRRDLHLSESSSNGDVSEEGGSHHSLRQDKRVEQNSPLSPLGHSRASQKDHTGKRLEVPPEPIFTEITGQEGRAPYSRLGANPIDSIRNSKKCKACSEVQKLSLVPLRKVIRLMLNLERQAGLWPKGCSNHQKFGLPRMLLCSCPRTLL